MQSPCFSVSSLQKNYPAAVLLALQPAHFTDCKMQYSSDQIPINAFP